MYNDSFLDKKLQERRENNSIRKLQLNKPSIDFCSNDYLGVVKHNLLPTYEANLAHGSTGSRLIAGNYELIEETEKNIASFHCAEAALIFNSGYDANVGILSCVPQRDDTIIYDYLCHASIRDGIRLSFAKAYSFEHNNIDDLEAKLKKAKGNVFVVTETVFSMDGDVCPLLEIVQLCQQYNAHLIIDEAHAIGVLGTKGEGLAHHLQLEQKIFARIYTYGKACGAHGAAIVGSKVLQAYLINFARSFIYTTALPPAAVAVINSSYNVFPTLIKEREHVTSLISIFQLSGIQGIMPSNTPIQGVIIGDNIKTKAIALALQQNNIDVRAILYPTVPKQTERLRIVLHAFNTVEEIQLLIAVLKANL